MNIVKESQKKGLSPDQFALRVKAIALAGSITLIGTAFGCTVGCSKNTPEEETQTTLYASLDEQLAGHVEPGSVKTFDVGEHIISVRVCYGDDNYVSTTYSINNMPEGYEVFDADPFTIRNGYGSSTAGYDIWFKNTEPVEVEASYNKVFENYGYYTFGKVVEKEKVLEK